MQPFQKELIKTIRRLKDDKQADAFLQNILTPTEYEEIARRLQIFKHLIKGTSQREVAKKLNVSIATISRGARELKYGVPGIASIFS